MEKKSETKIMKNSQYRIEYYPDLLFCFSPLVDNGAEIESKDWSGRTALHQAAYNGDLEIVKYLIEHGAKIEAKDNQNETPFGLSENRKQFKVSNYFSRIQN